MAGKLKPGKSQPRQGIPPSGSMKVLAMSKVQREEWYAECKLLRRASGVHERDLCPVCAACQKPRPGICAQCGTEYDQRGWIINRATGKAIDPATALDVFFP